MGINLLLSLLISIILLLFFTPKPFQVFLGMVDDRYVEHCLSAESYVGWCGEYWEQ